MKLHLLMALLTLAPGQALARQPASSDAELTNLKQCQQYRRMALVRETDDAVRQAEADLRAAFAAYRKFDATCKADASQNEEVSRRIGFEGADARQKGMLSRSSTATADRKLKELGTALAGLGLGTNDGCLQEVKKDIGDLRSFSDQLNEMQNRLASCGRPAGDPGRPTPR